MACWMIADETATRRKIAVARAHNVPTVTGGGPFEIAVAQGQLEAYLDLCAGLGVTRIECGEGFTELPQKPRAIVQVIHERGLEVQYEMGKKHEGPFTEESLKEAIARGHAWLDAGAVQVVVEARESARGVGMFDSEGKLNPAYADRFAEEFGFDVAIFEAPNKPSQFALLEHFGNQVHLCNVRLEELLRVEIFRRGLHSDAFAKPNLRPARPELQERLRDCGGRCHSGDNDSHNRRRSGSQVLSSPHTRGSSSARREIAQSSPRGRTRRKYAIWLRHEQQPSRFGSQD
jgi:phosphosulfolactate synthase